MVKIIYITDPTKKEHVIKQYKNIAEFMCENCQTEDDVRDMVFYMGDALGQRVTPYAGFSDVNEGTYTVISSKSFPGDPVSVIIAVVAAVVAVVVSVSMMKSLPEMNGRDQSSATNAITRATNEPRSNKRTDDIFGTVNKHTPGINQVPFTIGIDDIESEVMFGVVGRGKYLIERDRIFDNFTPYVNIPKARAAIYPPGSWPGNGEPQVKIGEGIPYPLGVYRAMDDIQENVLVPPNDSDRTDIKWSMIYNGDGTATMTIKNPDDVDVDLINTVKNGDTVNVLNTFYYVANGTSDLWYGNILGGGGQPDVKLTIDTYESHELNGGYVVTGVTANSLTFTVAGEPFESNWLLVTSEYIQPSTQFIFYNERGNVLFTTFNQPESNLNKTWFQKLINPDTSEEYYELVTLKSSSINNPSVNYLNTIYLGPYVLDEDATELITNISSRNGFYKLVDNNESKVDIEIEIIIQELDDDNQPTGENKSYIYPYGSNVDKTTKSVFRTFRSNVSMYQRKQVVYRRITNKDDADNVSNVTDATLTSVYTYQPCDLTKMGNVTTWYSLVPNNGQKQRQTRMDVTRLITEYKGNGVFGGVEELATNDFDQILIHMALDDKIGRLTLPEINADGFMLSKQQQIEYFGTDLISKFGYDFDTTEITFQEMFTTICSAVNMVPYTRGTIYDAFFERRQDKSSMQITCRNKYYESERVTPKYEEKYDGVALTYRDNETATHEVINWPNDDIINPERIEQNGITNVHQALVKAKRIYNKSKYGVYTVEFEVDEFGRNVVPGKRVDSPDGTRYTVRDNAEEGYRIFDGEIREVTGLVVELDNEVVFTPGEDHYIRFTTEDGNVTESILCTPGDDEFTVVLKNLPVEGLYDGYERMQTNYVFMSEQVNDSIALLPQTIESSNDGGTERNTITSLNYDHRYYNGDIVEL